MYGRRKSYRKGGTSTSYRRSGYSSGSNSLYAKNRGRSRYVKQKVYRRLSKKETKYDDDYYNLNAWAGFGGNPVGYISGFKDFVLGGVVETVKGVVAQANRRVGGVDNLKIQANEYLYAPNCLTNIDNGTTASTRIGNVVAPKFLTLKGVVRAALTNSVEDPETTAKLSGEEVPVAISRYCRTSIKIMVVRDKSMNEKGFVEYADLFAPPTSVSAGLDSVAVMNPFVWNRKLDTLGRYEVLRTMEMTLDQDDPQKSFTLLIPCMGIPIRYNGSASKQFVNDDYYTTALNGSGYAFDNYRAMASAKTSVDIQSMTNGLYLLAVAHCSTVDNNTMYSPSLVFSSRLSFEDA